MSSRLWHRKKKAAKITHPTAPLSLEEMQALRRKAKKGYKRAKRKHKENREDFLDKLPPKIRDPLKRVEQQRELGRLAKAVTGKLESKSVTKIEHNEQEMTSKADIEKVLLQINYEKTRASDNTPFMQEPLRSEFGYRNDTEAADLETEGVGINRHGFQVGMLGCH